MNKMNNLIENLTQKLENGFHVKRMVGSRPRVPMLLLYMGQDAYKAHEGISRVLQGVWRNRSNAICNFLVNDDSFYTSGEDNDQPLPVSKENFLMALDHMYENTTAFDNLRSLLLCLVYDTNDYESSQSFQQSYERIDELKKIAGQPNCLVLSIILFDEHSVNRQKTDDIREYLGERQREQSIHESTILLSNKLYGGGFCGVADNYELAGNLILLANHADQTYNLPFNHFFDPSNAIQILSASYAKEERPDRAICQVVVHRIINWLEKRLTEGNDLSLDRMCQRLEVKGGTLKFLNDVFDQNIRKGLPETEALECLPRTSKNMKKLSDMSFLEANRETLDSIRYFIDAEVKRQLSVANVDIEEECYQYLLKIIGIGEAASSLSDSMIEDIASQILIDDPDEKEKVFAYMTEAAKVNFYKRTLPVFKNQMREYRNIAQKQIVELQKLLKDLEEGFFVDDPTVQTFYEKLTDQYLAEKQIDVMGDINGKLLSKESILEWLQNTAEQVFQSDEVFQASLLDEMKARLGTNPATIQESIKTRLLGGISEKIRIQTTAAPTLLNETIILDQMGKDGCETTIFTYLKQILGNMNTFFLDSGNSNKIEVVRLYRVSWL